MKHNLNPLILSEHKGVLSKLKSKSVSISVALAFNRSEVPNQLQHFVMPISYCQYMGNLAIAELILLKTLLNIIILYFKFYNWLHDL